MYSLDIEDIEYLAHDGVALPARIYRPRGPGPFPAMVELHGGAWIKGATGPAVGAKFKGRNRLGSKKWSTVSRCAGNSISVARFMLT